MSLTPDSDRRRSQRIDHRMVARFEVGDRIERGVVANFSEIGLFLQSNVVLPEGTLVYIKVGSGQTLSLVGRVVWLCPSVKSANSQKPGGMGISLSAVPDDYLALVNKLKGEVDKLPRGIEERFEAYHPVRFVWEENKRSGMTENLSRGGMYLATKTLLRAGSVLDLELDIQGLEEPVDLKGRVAYYLNDEVAQERGRSAGAGIQFSDPESRSRALLDHYLTRLEIHRSLPERRRSEKLPLSGSLSVYLVPELLLLLESQKRSGTLALQRKNVVKNVFLKNGRPVFVESDVRSETLGNYLLREKKITSEQLGDSLEELARGDLRHGEILLKKGYIDSRTLADALVGQQEEKLTNTFRWFEGEFTFSFEEMWPDNISIFPMDTHALVFSGIRRFYNAALIEAWMGLHGQCALKKIAEPPSGIQLPGELQKVLHRIATIRTIDELVRILKVSEEIVLQAAYCLIIAGWAKFEFSAKDLSAPRFKEQEAAKEPLGSAELDRLRRKIDEDFRRFENLDFSQLLHVTPSTSEKELDRAFMEKTAAYLKVDPSQIPDEEVRNRVTQLTSWFRLAFETLKDPQLRQLYARRGAKKVDGAMRSTKIKAERALLAGVRALEKKEFILAVNQLQEATKIDPEDVTIQGYYGWALFQRDAKENLKRTCQLLDEAVFRDVSDPHIYFFRGQVAIYLANWRQAEKLFQRALRLYPNFLEAQVALEKARDQRIAEERLTKSS